MSGALQEMLPSAIGIALSPLVLVEMILVLLSKSAVRNGLVFLASIFAACVAVPLIASLFVDTATQNSRSERSAASGWILLALAAALLAFAYRNWSRRADRSAPAMLDKIAGMGTGAVLLLSLGATILNPKNLMLLIAGGSNLGAADPKGVSRLIAVVVYAVIATLPLIVAVGQLLVGGDNAAKRLDRWKEWLISNNHAILAVVLALASISLITTGITTIRG